MGAVFMGFLIIGLIIAGAATVVLVAFSMRWIIDRVKRALAKRNVKKVFIASMERLAAECPNSMSLADLERLSKGHRSYVAADIQDDGQVGAVDFINDSNASLDDEVASLLGEDEQVVLQ